MLDHKLSHLQHASFLSHTVISFCFCRLSPRFPSVCFCSRKALKLKTVSFALQNWHSTKKTVMARFRFIFDDLSCSRAGEQNSKILIALRKLIWCTHTVIEAGPPVTNSTKGYFFFLYDFCFYAYSLSALFCALIHPQADRCQV